MMPTCTLTLRPKQGHTGRMVSKRCQICIPGLVNILPLSWLCGMQALRQRQQAHQSQHQHLSATQQMAMLSEGSMGGMGGMGGGLLGNQVNRELSSVARHFW